MNREGESSLQPSNKRNTCNSIKNNFLYLIAVSCMKTTTLWTNKINIDKDNVS